MKGKLKKIKKRFSEKFYYVILIESVRKENHLNRLGESKAISIAFFCSAVIRDTLENGGSLFDHKLTKYIQIDEFYNEPWKYTYGAMFDAERYFLSEKSNEF